MRDSLSVYDKENHLLAIQGRALHAALRRFRAEGFDAEDMELVYDWLLDARIIRGLSVNTIASYLQSMARLLRWACENGARLHTLSRADIESWVKSLYMTDGLSEKTRSLHLTAVSVFFAWHASQTGGTDPTEGIARPRLSQREPRKYTDKQLQAMLGSCNQNTVNGIRNYALLIFMLATGARLSEVVAMDLDQLELSDRLGAVRFMGKGAKERSVMFEGLAVRTMKQWLATRDTIKPLIDTDAVWIGRGISNWGRRLGESGIRSVYHCAGQAAGLPPNAAGPHKMRVTFATKMYDHGHDIEVIRILMGHADIQTTRGYLAVSDRQRKARMPGQLLESIEHPNVASMPLWMQKKMRRVA